MGKTGRATIEINGRTYDAITGELVTAAVQPKHRPHANGHSIDGVVRAKSKSDTSSTPAKRAHTPAPAKAVHARTQRSATLHRQSVVRAKHHAHGHDKLVLASSSHDMIIGHERADRAKRIKRSQAISKFSAGLGNGAQPEPIIQPPVEAARPQAAPQLSPKEQLIAQHLAKVASTPHKPVKQRLSARTKAWLSRSRHGTIIATSATALLLIGYVTYLNIPNMALRVAASRAGFQAQLPGYQPAGFRFSGPIAYQPGEITMEYSSNTDDRGYIIRQKESNWDSQTLLDTYVSPQTGGLHATYQERGLIVYVYEGSVATWVNGGVWYTVEGDAGLTTEQLLKIAASL